MKKIPLFISIIVVFVTITSCKKTECTTTCQNGGKVTADCGCNCPPGFTGTNCEKVVPPPVVYTNATVTLDPNYVRQFCPTWYSGDDDYGGCLSIAWSVQLIVTDNDTKIYAKIYAHYQECSNTGSTRAIIDPSLASHQILLYNAPAGKKIYSINSRYFYSGTVYPNLNQHGPMLLTNSEVSSFLNKIEFVGDTAGPDLPCDGSEERSRYRIYFKSFGITLVN